MVRENLENCLKKISSANPSSNDLVVVAVTKGVALPLIYEAIDAGVRNIGENRIQEALLKYDSVEAYAEKKGIHLTWHMIGHLQTNKAKEAVRMFDLIHSLDSLHLAEKLNKEAACLGKVQDVLFEVKTSPEAAKYGFMPDEALSALAKMKDLKNIRIKGLMTIAPAVSDPEQARPYFRRLNELLNKMNHLPSSIFHLPSILSMGMTDDFQIAVQEGATMVRIGRGIFGPRSA